MTDTEKEIFDLRVRVGELEVKLESIEEQLREFPERIRQAFLEAGLIQGSAEDE